MKNERHSGRASRLLRPVLLAGAAAAVWLALSATSASAETGASQDELAGGPGSALSLAATPAPPAARQSPPSGSGGSSSGLLSPVLRVFPGHFEHAGIGVPAGAVDLSNPLTGLVSPAVELVDGAAAGVVQTANPVLAGLVTASAHVPDPPAVALAGVAPLPPAQAILPAAPAPSTDPGGAASTSPTSPRFDAAAGVATAGPAVPPAASRPPGLSQPSDPGTSTEAPQPAKGLPAGSVPAGPGSSAESSRSAPGPGAGAAAETAAFELRPPWGTGSARNPLNAAPQPVSFDPGSSPD